MTFVDWIPAICSTRECYVILDRVSFVQSLSPVPSILAWKITTGGMTAMGEREHELERFRKRELRFCSVLQWYRAGAFSVQPTQPTTTSPDFCKFVLVATRTWSLELRYS